MTQHHTLSPPAQHDLVTASVDADGSVYALWAEPADRAMLTGRTVSPAGVSFADPRTARPTRAVITVHGEDERAALRVNGLDLAHVTVQPMPDGETLIVGARAMWHPDGADQNAVIIDGDGRRLASATFGDGIEHVQTTPSGKIWVGYFDEGVFGNNDWGSPGPAPLGHTGLVQYTASLTPDWSFPSGAADTWGSIDDCYALNLADETAWTCYYSDFPVVRIEGGDVSGWQNSVRGVKALAINGDRVLLAGGYRPDSDRVVAARMDEGRLVPELVSRLVLPGGGRFPASASIVGRGDSLFVVADHTCYRLSVQDMPQ